MKKILLLFFAIFISVHCYAGSDILSTCLEKIAQNDKLWTEQLFNKKNGIFKSLKDDEELTDQMVQNQKAQIYALIGKNILLNCRDNMADISKISRGLIKFKHNNVEYSFDFSTATLFDYMDIRTGFLVINKKNLKPGNVIKVSDIPKKKKFFPDECSDWTIWDNLDDDAAVNVAGQAVFNEFGGAKNEFFLDFAEGDNRRAFPGLVLMDETGSTKEKIVTYRNLQTGFKKMNALGAKLKSSACSNSGLALYLVALDVKQDTSSERRGWAIAAAVGGGAAVWIGASAVAVATGTTAITGALAEAMLVTAVGASSVPVAGWIVAGVLAIGATAVALYPAEIEKIPQVMVLAGPYIL